MAIKELDAGQRHTFAPTALRVQLTGASHGDGVVLKALDQAGHEAVTVRLTDVEVVLTPEPRRLRLVAMPSSGGSFRGGTNLGLTLRTEGASTAAEQILVSGLDVGALTSYEIAVLEFATDRAVLTVSRVRGDSAPGILTPDGPTPSTPGADGERAWLRGGRYAFRDAEKLGRVGSPVTKWAVVLDGSASMCPMFGSGQLQRLLELVCGIYVQWTARWSSAMTVAGVAVSDVDEAAHEPKALAEAAFNGTEPSSWSSITEATKSALRRTEEDGAVLIVTDGAPGDIDRLTMLCRDNSGVRFHIVTTGISRFGVDSDDQPAWWREELAGLEDFVSLPNCSAVAVRLQGDRLELDGSRAAELALRLTAPLTTGAPA